MQFKKSLLLGGLLKLSISDKSKKGRKIFCEYK